MKFRSSILLAALACSFFAGGLLAQSDDATNKLARDIYKQLIEINTTDSVGSTTVAAEAMAQRLRDAGYAASDVQVIGPNARKGNLVARLRGTGAQKPMLLICHLDVVEARREDWSMDPFQFIEKDGYFYGRGSGDIKDGDAILMTAMIRLKQEGFKPDRDIIPVSYTHLSENGAKRFIAKRAESIPSNFLWTPSQNRFLTIKHLATTQTNVKS